MAGRTGVILAASNAVIGRGYDDREPSHLCFGKN